MIGVRLWKGGANASAGVAEGTVAGEVEGALDARLELLHAALCCCVGSRGSGIQLQFQKHLEPDVGTKECF